MYGGELKWGRPLGRLRISQGQSDKVVPTASLLTCLRKEALVSRFIRSNLDFWSFHQPLQKFGFHTAVTAASTQFIGTEKSIEEIDGPLKLVYAIPCLENDYCVSG